eukprot:gene8056-10914_t
MNSTATVHNSEPPASGKLSLGLDLLSRLDRPSDKELRILIFTATYFVLDGVTLTIRRIESYLRSKGATVKILTTVPDHIAPSELKDCIVVPGIKIPFTHAGDYSFGLGLDEATARAIEEYNPTCVHFTVPDFVSLDGIRWCQKNHVAYIGTWHSNYIEYLKYYFIEWVLGPGMHRYLVGFYEQIPTVYVPTVYMLKRMKEEWGYGRCTNLVEWGRGVDMNMFTPDRRSQAFRTAKGISEDDVVVLWVGRIVPEKRPDIWMHVVKRLQDEGLPVKALVVGSGTFEKYLSTLKHVACCGWLSGADLGEAYASADILLFPSDVETFGNVTLEALSAGCPSIVEKNCGEHLVENDINGFTCTNGDFEEFYEATRRLVMDKQLRKQMSINARAGAWKYERGVILQQMVDHYKDAILQHADPSFLKRHLQAPLGRGWNVLSFFCCNYILVRACTVPFLNTSRGVQDLVDNGSECISMSRSRLSCADKLNTAVDIETYDDDSQSESRYEDEKKGRRHTAFSFCSTHTVAILTNAVHYAALIASVLLIILFVYASFTV